MEKIPFLEHSWFDDFSRQRFPPSGPIFLSVLIIDSKRVNNNNQQRQ